jgi:ribosomal protein L37AE/L43A
LEGLSPKVFDKSCGQSRADNCSCQGQLLTAERAAMECPKCKGLMGLERFSDFFLVFYAWKCINCGAVMDKTIANNRRNSLALKQSLELAKVG